MKSFFANSQHIVFVVVEHYLPLLFSPTWKIFLKNDLFSMQNKHNACIYVPFINLENIYFLELCSIVFF